MADRVCASQVFYELCFVEQYLEKTWDVKIYIV